MKKINYDFWKNKKVLITGHTGFKGGWASLVLTYLGSKVVGYSLKPNRNSLYTKLKLKNKIYKSFYFDINDKKNLKKILLNEKPDLILHFAAQSLVLESYKDPIKTIKSNIFGTFNILQTITELKKKPRSVIIVTSDKCYENKNLNRKFNENDKLGGNDLYSASKACCEILSSAYNSSFFKSRLIATVRAGNVIGGGDFAENRIVPDYYNSYKNNKPLKIRNPKHIRPWQYVLDVVNGYLILAEKLFYNKKYAQSWNFGPENSNLIDVQKLIKKFNIINQKKVNIVIPVKKSYKKKEEKKILLSNTKSKKFLKWRIKKNLNEMINDTNQWYMNYINNKNIYKFSVKQIKNYFNGN